MTKRTATAALILASAAALVLSFGIDTTSSAPVVTMTAGTSELPEGWCSAYRGEPGEDSTVVEPCDGTEALCETDADCAALGYQGELGYGVTEDKVRTYSDRYEIPESDQDDPIAECLWAQGYRGLDNDGVEALYAPAAQIEGCAAVSK